MWKLFCNIEIHGDPVATQRARFDTRRKIAYKPTKTRQAMNRRTSLMKRHVSQNRLSKIVDQPIRVELDFYHSRPKRLMRKKDPSEPIPKITKPDVDNLAKLILDSATQAELWNDDNLITQLEIRDWYVAKTNEPKSVMLVYTFDEE
jgi:Holliday junction resolvase RusA-like endonuclease